MRVMRNIVLSTGILLLGFSLARAQEKAPAADAPSAGQTDEKQQFDRVFSDWKEKLKQLREVQVKFQKADTGEQKTFRKEFQTLVDEAKVLVPQLTSAAEKAYLAAPNQDKDVLDFMSSVLADHANKDNYEDAYRVAKLLVDNKADAKKLYSMGGVAAFMTHHYDEAEELLETARKNGELAALPQGSPEFLTRLNQLAEQSAGGIEKYRKLWAKEKEIRAAQAKADDLPRVKLETSQGDVVIELYENEAPIATANFISLVEKGYYNGLKFHRVLPGFMAQGGCPQGTGTGGPGYNIPCECYQENYRTHFRGSLSMAHAGRDTGGSQFFLTFVHTPHLDAKHTVFGRVIEGMGVTAQLRRVEPNKGGQADTITKATVIRKRDHEYEPKKLPAR